MPAKKNVRGRPRVTLAASQTKSLDTVLVSDAGDAMEAISAFVRGAKKLF